MCGGVWWGSRGVLGERQGSWVGEGRFMHRGWIAVVWSVSPPLWLRVLPPCGCHLKAQFPLRHLRVMGEWKGVLLGTDGERTEEEGEGRKGA